MNSSQEIEPTQLIHFSISAPPVTIPAGHVGPVTLPGSGRQVWWTGRVAIGLRHEPQRFRTAVPESTLWVQRLMLGAPRSLAS